MIMPCNQSSDNYPLIGKTILVTRAASANSQFRQMLEAKGATVLEMPALVIKPPSSWLKLDQAIADLSSFNWLILTSANAVSYFYQRLTELGKNNQDLTHLKIAVVGKKTAEFLSKYHLLADFIPPNFVADSLVANFPEKLSGKKILFPRVETGGREILVEELQEQGAKVIEVPAYQSVCPDSLDETVAHALREGTIDIITFASSKTVKNFANLVNRALVNNSEISFEQLFQQVAIASIGPQTSTTCQEIFQRVDIEAEEYTLEGLTTAMIQQSE
jgi:uroporphyrinogen-III synthase